MLVQIKCMIMLLFVFIIDDKFASQTLFLQDALTFQNAISLFYITLVVALQYRVPSPRIWAIYEAMVKVLSLIMSGCVLNQSRGQWLLLDAL